MNSILLFVLLQFNLFGNPGTPLSEVKLSVEEASSHEVIAFVKVGKSGQFLFSNLDPGNYFLHLEVPENTAKKVDKKERQKFDTDIEVAFNKDKDSYLWQHPDGFIKVELNRDNKLADSFIPFFELESPSLSKSDEDEDSGDIIGAILKKKAEAEKMMNAQEIQKVKILQFTVIGEYGTIGGDIRSISQKEYYNLTVGKDDETLESQGDVEVLKRLE